jgi:hypothetical protein
MTKRILSCIMILLALGVVIYIGGPKAMGAILILGFIGGGIILITEG